MNNLFGIIYFIHDDMGQEFRLNIVPTILKASFHENIKVILIHNKRKLFKSSSGREFVTYKTVVSEVVKKNNKPSFKELHNGLPDWKAAFLFSFKILKDHGISLRIGIITLSHSNGIAINRNNENTPVQVIKIWNLLRRLFKKEPAPDFNYLEKFTNNGSLLWNAETILGAVPVEKIDNKGEDLIVYESEYSRRGDSNFCKKYEGLFFSELSKFIQDVLKNEMDIKHGKICFYISSNCNFQLYDNMFLFAPISEFIMGAQSFNSSSLWNFPIIINAIYENINKGGKDISTAIFDRCTDKFARERTERTEHYFLSDTSDFKVLHPVFEEMISALITNIKGRVGFKENLIARIANLERTSDDDAIPYFDILAFLKTANDIAELKFDTAIGQFADLLNNNIIISNFPGDFSHSGFSLYLPRNKDEFNVLNGADCNYFSEANRNNFSLNSKFDEFLNALYE